MIRGLTARAIGALLALAVLAPAPAYSQNARATQALGTALQARTGSLTNAASVSRSVDMLVVIGDSNARGNAADEASSVFIIDPMVTTWDNTTRAFVTWNPAAKTGMTVPNAATGAERRVGSEYRFARRWRADNPYRTLSIVKCARAGSYQTYSASAPVSGDATNSWDATSGTLLGFCRAQYQGARAAIVATGATPRLVAIVDASGTNDAADATLSSNVQAAKTAMYASIRANWSIDSGTTFLTVRQMSTSPQANIGTVRVAQSAVANAAADALLIATDGFGNNGSNDLTHFSIAGLAQLGDAEYAAWSGRMSAQILALKSKIAFAVDAAQADTLTTSGSAVSGLIDMVANKSLNQGTAANQPALDASAPGGKAALVFNGATSALAQTATNSLGSGDREFFAIVRSDRAATDSTSSIFFSRGGGTSATDFRLSRTVVSGINRFRFQQGGAGSTNYAVTDTQVAADPGTWHVVAARVVGGTTLYISVDGQAEQVATAGAAQNVTDGNLVVGASPGFGWWGGAVRLVIETTTLTNDQRYALINALRTEAGQ